MLPNFSFRWLLIATFSLVLTWQVVKSVSKYLSGDIALAHETTYTEEVVFPRVSLCPNKDHRDDRRNWTFAEHYDAVHELTGVVVKWWYNRS